ncbi:protein STAY-GREEN, chloroplastic-like [Senna tora]|uniref:Protein STAY-GREEN, chloroplastic-like n=1 Tax=Senna tora TaxID=362788 RepID=A0A834WCI3_9FABA|nr:protein STAY-GREEN, chloroplastic-like [Senna tora]
MIFCKELPLVLEVFVHGDGNLLNNYPELQEALVWAYFHSNIPEFNKVECWGPLKEASSSSSPSSGSHEENAQEASPTPSNQESPPRPCKRDCDCCFFPPVSLIPWSPELPRHHNLSS